jgi:hypothetical protein
MKRVYEWGKPFMFVLLVHWRKRSVRNLPCVTHTNKLLLDRLETNGYRLFSPQRPRSEECFHFDHLRNISISMAFLNHNSASTFHCV